MKIRDFAVKVTKKEAGKKEVSIAQIMEILKIVDALTAGMLYRIIRSM